MRSRPKQTSRVPTETQLPQREKFSMVTPAFLLLSGGVLNLYSGQSRGVRSRYNLAVYYHIREAVEETHQ